MYNFIQKIFENDKIIYLHGEVMQKLIRNETIVDKDELHIFLPKHNHIETEKLIEDLAVFYGNDFLMTKKYRNFSVNVRCSPIIPNYWICQLLLAKPCEIKLVIYNSDTRRYIFDVDNFMFTQNSFITYYQSTDDYNQHRFFINSLKNIINNSCSVINITKSELEKEANSNFAPIMYEQNKYIKQKKTILKGLLNSNEKDDFCNICYTKVYIYVLECEHIFCSNCLDKHICSIWLKNNKKCPICRQKINVKSICE